MIRLRGESTYSGVGWVSQESRVEFFDQRRKVPAHVSIYSGPEAH